MGRKRTKLLLPEQIEAELQKAREKDGLVGKVEHDLIKSKVDDAILNGRFNDKVLMTVKPIHLHIPMWQRELQVSRAIEIGTNYNKHKWDMPKVLYNDGKLFVIDGMNRTYGAFVAGMERIVVEVLTDITEQEAIDIFLNQSKDRKEMTQKDLYSASIAYGIKEYLKLKEICEKNKIKVKGDRNSIDNPIGILTSISDGLYLAKYNPELLERIIVIINKLQWNAGKSLKDGKAYSAKTIRVFKKLYAYYSDRLEDMENVLLNTCKGSEFFNNNLYEKAQDTIFDSLSAIIERNIDIVTINAKKPTKTNKRSKAVTA